MKKSTLTLTIVSLILTLVLIFKNFISVASAVTIKKFSIEYRLPSLAPMLEKVIPSVVSINVEGNTTAPDLKHSHELSQFFRDKFFIYQKKKSLINFGFYQKHSKKDISKNEKFRALGSGVIINSKKGYIVTNNHVVNHADKIKVQLYNGRKYPAIVIGKDVRSDIALIKLQNATNLTAIKVANSDKIRVGDYVVAIGNPYGLGETVTSGIVSAIGRSGLNIEHYEDFIQTDAAINKGNSGGALINLKGELIGINTAILAPNGGNIGIGFAIPSNIVKNLTKQIVNFGQVQRGELGIVGTELSSELAEAMSLNIQKGAFVSQVYPKSVADQAGIKSGDVIIFLNNKPIYSFLSLRADISSIPINTKITLGILRNGHIKKFIVKLKKSLREKIDSANINVGIEGAELRNYEFKGCKGVLITDVKIHTTAFNIGLRKNDVIFGINKIAVPNIKTLRRLLSIKNSVLAFSIKRGNATIYLIIK